ncbi:hypothetical protein SCUCBS95973_004732 [Sporothrix curviconia]|uniref:Yeast cell wall synthesis Kre9/Knh1-like N-terminal domain-containing protein n=1 Tax=Sporothrix curviconia TaxID=1260050 RepID=A0ABP0BQY1_9PEZI
MSSYKTLISVLALAAAVAAQDPNFDSINTPVKDAQVPAGQPFTITWTLLSATTPTGPITITLIGGASSASLNPIAAIGHANNQDLQFVWNVDASLGSQPVYGLNITLDADNSHFQYSQPFQIVGGSGTSSSSSSAAGSSSSSTSSTASSGSSSGSSSTVTSVTTTTNTPTTTTTVSSTSSAESTKPTTTSATSHPTGGNGTATHTGLTSTANKTTAAATTTATSGAVVGMHALPALGALAMALVAGAAMNWGL